MCVSSCVPDEESKDFESLNLLLCYAETVAVLQCTQLNCQNLFSVFIKLYLYRPQTKLQKGNVFTSVHVSRILSTGEGRRGVHPPGSRHPQADTPMGRHPATGRHFRRQMPPGQTPPRQTPLWADTPPPSDGYCSRQDASYCNAFLYYLCFMVKIYLRWEGFHLLICILFKF